MAIFLLSQGSKTGLNFSSTSGKTQVLEAVTYAATIDHRGNELIRIGRMPRYFHESRRPIQEIVRNEPLPIRALPIRFALDQPLVESHILGALSVQCGVILEALLSSHYLLCRDREQALD